MNPNGHHGREPGTGPETPTATATAAATAQRDQMRRDTPLLARPRKLALRIYLIGLVQVAAIIAGIGLLKQAFDPPGEGHLRREALFAMSALDSCSDDRRTLERRLHYLREKLGAHATIYDGQQRMIASTIQPPLPPVLDLPIPHEPMVLKRPHQQGRVVIVPRPPHLGGGYAVFDAPKFHGPRVHPALIGGMILILVGVSSVVAARWLARPLQQLSVAARSFGRGNLNARVVYGGRDEFGEVAGAFNEMADRVGGLVRSQKELLANVSHELRTPLARIRVALDIAQEGNAALAQKSLGGIAEDLAELERLVGDILASARLELDGEGGGTGLPTLRREHLDAEAILSASAERLRAAHPERMLVTSIQHGLGAIDGDRVMLRRAFDNLLENAAKYSDKPEGRVFFEARSVDGKLAVTIRDEGIGIAPDDMKKVFTPFFRADKSRTRATGGLGLGLNLTRRIVEAHGGHIGLSSEYGRGTTVTVELPYVTP